MTKTRIQNRMNDMDGFPYNVISTFSAPRIVLLIHMCFNWFLIVLTILGVPDLLDFSAMFGCRANANDIPVVKDLYRLYFGLMVCLISNFYLIQSDFRSMQQQ